MLYMKEQRAKVVAECTLKESAAINQILGRKVGSYVSLAIVQHSILFLIKTSLAIFLLFNGIET